ncbi:MAG: glycosyltransferase family 39 protein [Deltaproteobacteria bacterium]|nr:glycosyltransferase family 39 protein [Deltaproteobacteria bacterium]
MSAYGKRDRASNFTPSPSHGPEGPPSRSYLAWGALFLVIVFTAFVRLRLASAPLERDEGVYAYIAQLILDGIPPYVEAYDMRMPGLYAIYAAIIFFFGQTQAGVHTGLLAINGSTIFFLFLLARRLYGNFPAVAAASFFAVISMSSTVDGLFANTEHFVILHAVAGLYAFVRATDEDNKRLLFISGILLGTAFTIKQHGFVFTAATAAFLLLTCKKTAGAVALFSRLTILAAGAALPLLLACGTLYLLGAFDKFWFWIFTYAQTYVSMTTLSAGLVNLENEMTGIVAESLPVWVLALFGLCSPLWDKATRRRWLFVSLFALASFAAIMPGFFFRSHYFQFLLPAAAVSAGAGLSSAGRVVSKYAGPMAGKTVVALLVVSSLLYALNAQRDILFYSTPYEVTRKTYGPNPFPESLEVAEYIRKNTSPEEKIAVIGSEPQIYFYSDRRSATRYIYTYPLMELQPYAKQMQKEMASDIEAAGPAYVVFINNNLSWLVRPGSERFIFTWFNDYRRDFELVGLIEIFEDRTVYRWDADVLNYKPRPGNNIQIYRRRR